MLRSRGLFRSSILIFLSGVIIIVCCVNYFLFKSTSLSGDYENSRLRFVRQQESVDTHFLHDINGDLKLSEGMESQRNVRRFIGMSELPETRTLMMNERIKKFFPYHEFITPKRTFADLQQNVVENGRLCRKFPPALKGRLDIASNITLEELWDEEVLRNVQPGGIYKPRDCVPRDNVAIIIPFRDRYAHLEIFLMHMHTILQRQQLAYAIYVVEVALPTQFNRGLLANVGFLTAKSIADYSCYVIHDVDLLPADDRNIYTCSRNPRHLSVANSKFGYRLPYDTYTGGVVMFTSSQFLHINGFSNLYFGWGAEDDDVSTRIVKGGYTLDRPLDSIGVYEALKHGKDSSNPVNPHKDTLYRYASRRIYKDGVNSVYYSRLALEFNRLYTWVYISTSESLVVQDFRADLGYAPMPTINPFFGRLESRFKDKYWKKIKSSDPFNVQGTKESKASLKPLQKLASLKTKRPPVRRSKNVTSELSGLPLPKKTKSGVISVNSTYKSTKSVTYRTSSVTQLNSTGVTETEN